MSKLKIGQVFRAATEMSYFSFKEIFEFLIRMKECGGDRNGERGFQKITDV